MKSVILERSSWTRGRFLGVVAVLFVLQAGLLFLFGDRSRPQARLSARSVRFQALGASVTQDQLMRQYFVGDPAVFPLPNVHGFSGRGWLDERPPQYEPENQFEAPDWLPLNTAHLGTNFPVPAPGFEPALLEQTEQQAWQEEPPPLFLSQEMIATQSVFRIEGGLGDRLLGAAPVLGNWPNPQLLGHSTVQIAVDSAGEVLAARLDSRSGSDEADADALAKARALRFRPSPSAGTQWGAAVFQWRTIEPAAPDPPK